MKTEAEKHAFPVTTYVESMVLTLELTTAEHEALRHIITMLTARALRIRPDNKGERKFVVSYGTDMIERIITEEQFKILNQLDDTLNNQEHERKDRTNDYK